MGIFRLVCVVGLLLGPVFAQQNNTTPTTNKTTTAPSNATTTILPKTTEKNESTTGKSTEKPAGSTARANMTEGIQIRSGRGPGRFWKSLLIPLGGHMKVGIHGDLTNVASGNLESKGSIGISVNGHDLSVGARWGVGGNLGQGVNNAGSLGIGGTGEIQSPRRRKKTAASPAPPVQNPPQGKQQLKQDVVISSFTGIPYKDLNGMETKGKQGEWKNTNDYFQVFVETPQPGK